MTNHEQEQARADLALLRFRMSLAKREPFGRAELCFTGSRSGPTQAQIDTWNRLRPRIRGIVAHDGCAIGWDRFVALNGGTGWTFEFWPANTDGQNWAWRTFDRNAHTFRAIRAPLLRNRCMVDDSNGVIAAPSSSAEVLRSGTWATIRYARKVGKPVLVIWPNGEIVMDGSLRPSPEGSAA